jgi:hypothetical protein
MEQSEEQYKTFRNLVTYYCSQGLSILALPPKSKIPSMKWKEYQERHPTIEEITEWFKEFQNIAIITGNLSNICVIDIDESTPEANELISKLPYTFTVETGNGGLHFYFKMPKGKSLPNFCRRIPGVDFRGEGGYVLAPPSIHPNGNAYKITEFPESWDDIPELPYELLESCFEDGSANKGKIQDILESAEIPEGQRNTDLYLIAQQLHSGFPKQQKLAWEMFKAFAKDKCASTYAEAYIKGELGSIFNSASNSRIASEALEQYESAHEPGSWLNPITIRDLLRSDFPEPKWIVDTLLKEKGIAMLSGDPASYKTFLLLDLAICFATGGMWLNKFQCEKQKVWMLDKESILSNLKKRFECMRGGKEVIESEDIILSCDQVVTLHKDGKIWDQTLEKAAQRGVKVLIMDSFRRFITGSENESEVTNNFFSQIAKCRTFGISVIFTHHHKKKVKDIREEASQKLRGSSDILSYLDTHLVVEKATDGPLLKLTPNKIKEGPEVEPIAIRRATDENNLIFFESEGSASNFVFDSKPKESEKASKRIMEILKNVPLGLLRKEIDEQLVPKEFSKDAITKALKMLQTQELILKVGSGGKGDYSTKYILVKDE